MCIAPADIQIGTDSFEFYFNKSEYHDRDSLKIVNRFGAAESVDNCTANIIELTPEYPYYFTRCKQQRVYRRFLAIDENGNQSKDTCRQLVGTDPAKNREQIIQIPSLYEPFQAFISADTFTSLGAGSFLLRQWGGPEIIGNDTLIHYWVLNKCRSANSSIHTYYLPIFDIDGDGRKGDAYTMRIANDSLYFERPNLRDSVVVFPNTTWRYTLDLEQPSNQGYSISGTVFTDLNSNCEKELDENGVPGFFITGRSFPSRNTFRINTSSSGTYKLTYSTNPSDTLFEIGYTTDSDTEQACGNSFSIKIPTDTLSIQHDFAINSQFYDFSGTVFTDLNSNCEKESDENPIPNFTIIVRSFPSEATFETSTNSLGDYNLTALIPLSDTLFEVGYTTDLNIGQACGNSFRIPSDRTSIQQDFAINLVQYRGN